MNIRSQTWSVSWILMISWLPLVAIPESLTAQTASPEALIAAAQNGDQAAVAAELDAGVDVNARTRYGASALSFAAEKGHLEIVRLLIERGADVNVQDTFYNATPLTWASMNRHKEVYRLLKDSGAELPTIRAGEDAKKKKPDSESKTASGENASADDTPTDFPVDSTESRMADRAVSGPNWPGFRGTGARGIADGQQPPLRWNVPQDKNVLWKTEIEGLGHSCPAIWGDCIFLTSAISSAGDNSLKIGNYGGVTAVDDESEHRFVVFCVNKHSGQIVWQQEATRGVPRVKRHLKSTHANPTVATNGQYVVASFGGQGLFCYTVEGDLVWQRDLGLLDSGWFYDKTYQWGFASSPVIFEDQVIVQCDVQEQSFVASLGLSDGHETWRTERDEIPGWSSPTVVDSPRGPMLLTHASGFARGYDARTGESWWQFGKHSEIVVPTPFVAHDLIYITSGYSPIQPIAAISLDATGDITLDDGQTSSEFVRWYRPRGGPYMPSPLVYGDYLYLCSNDGRLTCLVARTGQQVYRKRLSEGFKDLSEPPDASARLSFVGSPVAADGYLYFPAEDGNILVLQAGPEFRLLAANPVGEYVLSTPAISEGVLYVRGQQHLIALIDKGQMDSAAEGAAEASPDETARQRPDPPENDSGSNHPGN